MSMRAARPGEIPEDYVKRVARDKAMAVGAAPERDCAGRRYRGRDRRRDSGKTRDTADADRMLGLLAGREHQVLTGICLRRGIDVVIDCAVTRVWFVRSRAKKLRVRGERRAHG